ncbi:hypothetical protein [Nocardia sp. NPDC004860]|uniref:hypothetical protein n=1 Tax=Nocardia sp. NPDC004860 TaxID=3154557 RepID=UPI0033B4801B
MSNAILKSVGHGEGVGEFAAGGDPELREVLVQLPFDRASAEEQLPADLGVG